NDDRRLIALQELVDALLLRGLQGRPELDHLERHRELPWATGVARGLVLEERLDLGPARGIAEERREPRKLRGGFAREPLGEPVEVRLQERPRHGERLAVRPLLPEDIDRLASVELARERQCERDWDDGRVAEVPESVEETRALPPVRRLFRLREVRLEQFHVSMPRGATEDGGRHERVDRAPGL